MREWELGRTPLNLGSGPASLVNEVPEIRPLRSVTLAFSWRSVHSIVRERLAAAQSRTLHHPDSQCSICVQNVA